MPLACPSHSVSECFIHLERLCLPFLVNFYITTTLLGTLGWARYSRNIPITHLSYHRTHPPSVGGLPHHRPHPPSVRGLSPHRTHPPSVSGLPITEPTPHLSVVRFPSWTKGSDAIQCISPTLNTGSGTHRRVLVGYTNMTDSVIPPLSGEKLIFHSCHTHSHYHSIFFLNYLLSNIRTKS